MTYQETAYQKTNIVDANGNIISSFGGGGGGGDASTTNQQAQIALETAIRDRLPSTLVSDRLKVDGSGVIQPVSLSSVPLASNAATDTTLQQVRDAIKAQLDIASTIWTDNSGAFYVRRDLVNEGTGTITVTFTDPTGSAATPGAGLRPLATTDKDTITDFYDVLASGTGYSTGDLLARVAILDVNSGSPSATFVWLNLTTGTILGSAPTSANIERANENVGARQVGNWNVTILNSSIEIANDIGNPVPVNGNVTINNTEFLAYLEALYSATLPTLTDGQKTNLRTTQRGELITSFVDFVSSTINISAADAGSISTAGADSQTIFSGTPTASSFASVSISGDSSFAIQIDGTFVGTLQFERSLDNGATYTAISAFAAGTAYTRSTTTQIGRWHGNCSSSNSIRVRATSWTSGTANVKILAGAGTGTITIGNPIRLFDQISGVQASIKAASVAPVLADTALVFTERRESIAGNNGSLTLTNANTEYSFALTNARSYAFKILSGGDIRFAYTTGKVATPTLPYYTLTTSLEEAKDFSKEAFTGTLYFASSTAGTIVIIQYWS
ncbi:hypothetical protein [Nostoc sp. TCL240-02]|uniref:hypothetical protein n=1 Tax=Nostoc sp. TCL240-02 TaxID=2572090 RepID=UPI00157FAF2D|nr:hypothetical protein [Nostoc sp. TCL240-02]QKQ75579.1 hypothetical protein FBB35_21860 [Nostoc sp. TCL240-02]